MKTILKFIGVMTLVWSSASQAEHVPNRNYWERKIEHCTTLRYNDLVRACLLRVQAQQNTYQLKLLEQLLKESQ